MKAAVLALLLAGCVAVTINVSFPQEKIEGAAQSIEDLVRTPKEPPKSTPAPGRQGGRDATPNARWALARAWDTWMGPRSAEAQAVPELKTQTPEVLAIVDSRRGRFPQLNAAQASGCVGENNQGLVETRPGQGCAANLGSLVSSENRDRMALYKILVEQNNMPPADISRVQAAFGKVNREKASAGTWVQGEGGQWTRK